MFKVVGRKLYIDNCLYFYPEKFCLLRTYSSNEMAIKDGIRLAKQRHESIIIEEDSNMKAMMERDA